MTLRCVPGFNVQIKVVSNARRCVGRDVSNGSILRWHKWDYNSGHQGDVDTRKRHRASGFHEEPGPSGCPPFPSGALTAGTGRAPLTCVLQCELPLIPNHEGRGHERISYQLPSA